MPKAQSPRKPTSRRYSPEEKAAAVRKVRALRAELGTEHGTVRRVARQLGYGVESVRKWVRQAYIDHGYASGVSTVESARIGSLNSRSKNLSVPTRSSSDRPDSSGRSSTANTRNGRFHRRSSWRVRGRAHLHRPA